MVEVLKVKDILLILLLQLIYVPIYTLRTIFLVKNITVLASILGIVEMLIYVFGLSLVFGGEQNIASMVVYAVGFGLGIILGTKLEQKYSYWIYKRNSEHSRKKLQFDRYLKTQWFRCYFIYR